MAGKKEKRPYNAKDFRNMQMYLRYKRGWSLARLSKKYGISKARACQICTKLENKVLSTMLADARLMKEQNVSRLEYIITENLIAWEESKRPKVTTTEEREEGGENPKIRRITKTERGTPDASYLATALRAISDQNNMVGIGHSDKPEQPVIDILITEIETQEEFVSFQDLAKTIEVTSNKPESTSDEDSSQDSGGNRK